MKRMIWTGLAVFLCTGCATFSENRPMSADQTAQAFFERLQASNNQGAYGLLGQGLRQRIAFDQFDQLMQTIRQQWGRIETDETELLPFHRRVGEADFIPLRVKPQQVRRYIFDVTFENARMNFDLTLAPEGDGCKIVWFSVWGSSIYVTPQIKQKIGRLFGGSDDSSS